ncbi:unnamed protein product, partial [Amoebophrya sp. A120]
LEVIRKEDSETLRTSCRKQMEHTVAGTTSALRGIFENKESGTRVADKNDHSYGLDADVDIISLQASVDTILTKAT